MEAHLAKGPLMSDLDQTPATPQDRWAGLLDIPWGVLVFLVLVVGGFVWTLASSELQAGDYLTAVGGGAGLLAVGHGIRSHGKQPRS
jgi:hypothetical protein